MSEWKQYVEVLLTTPQRPDVREVAEHLNGMQFGPLMVDYLEHIIRFNAENSRVAEIAYELLMHLTGWAA